MVELVSFLTGSFFLYFGIKMLLTKVFLDIGMWLFTNKWVLLILVGGILSYTLLPLTQPYIDSTIDLFIGGVISIMEYLWDILHNLLTSILGSGVDSFFS